MRTRSLDALLDAQAIVLDGTGYRIDAGRVTAVQLALLAIAPYLAPPTYPPVYLTPPDLLTSMSEDVGELRRLLIELIAAARSRISIVTPFFSATAFREILTPLEDSNVQATVSLYLSAPHSEADRALVLFHTVKELLVGRRVLLYVNSRPDDALASLPHAKLLLCDGAVGYLGSANISLHGLREQFEVGVRLEGRAVRTLEQAIETLVERGVYELYQPG